MAIDEMNNNDYISAGDYNKICAELASAKASRSLGSGKPSNVAAGDAISQTQLKELQDAVNNTIRYGSATRYSFLNQEMNGPPLALLYNQVRQVVVDLQTNQRCITCSNACRQACSSNCYSSCASGCSTSCSGCYSCTGGCGGTCTGCGSGCANGCNGCKSGCGGSCLGCDGCSGGCGGQCSGCDGCTGECSTACSSGCDNSCSGCRS